MHFKDLKIGSKQGVGFGLLILILVALGGTSYYMFGKIAQEVGMMGDRYIPATTNANNVERLTWDAIRQQREYLIEKTDQHRDGVKQNLQLVQKDLDEVDAIAQKYNDTALAEQTKNARDLVQQYGAKFDEGVRIIKDNDRLAATMDQAGETVASNAKAYMAAKQTEYNEVKRALAVVNRISALAFEARMNEKAYMGMSNSSRETDRKNFTDFIAEKLKEARSVDVLWTQEWWKQQTQAFKQEDSEQNPSVQWQAK